MNFDMTFCSGLRCTRKENCERWSERVTRWADANNKSLEGFMVRMAQFADHEGKCEEYMPVAASEVKDDCK